MSIDTSDNFATASLEDLENLARVISMEGLAIGALNFDPKRRFNQFMDQAGQFFKKVKFEALASFKVASGDMNSVVSHYGYVQSATKEIVVPEGFIGQWLPYSACLKEAMQKASKSEFVIRSFNDTLGRLINDPELLKALSGVGHSGQTNMGLDEAMRYIGKTFFDGRSNHITRTLGAVVERTADIPQVHNNVNDAIALDKAHPASKVLEAIDRTMQLANTIVPMAEGKDSISKAALQELIDITLELAREMEAYGVLLFRIRQFSESLKDSVKMLKK